MMELNSVELSVLDAFENDRKIPENLKPSEDNILRAVLQLILAAGKRLRSVRNRVDTIQLMRKEDGSVVTPFDFEVEALVKKGLSCAFPEFDFIGEEGGGKFGRREFTAAIDPIDGSSSFTAHDVTSVVSLSIFKGEKVLFGVVLNHSTGEVAYSLGSHPTRLIQLSCFGESHSARDLPSKKTARKGDSIMVNLQPAKGHLKYDQALKNAWKRRKINYVKSQGGSPALGLLEAAKGHYLYVHPWELSPSTPYDLSAGIKLVENAGGSVVSLEGFGIRPVGHYGIFIAGTNRAHQEIIRTILQHG